MLDVTLVTVGIAVSKTKSLFTDKEPAVPIENKVKSASFEAASLMEPVFNGTIAKPESLSAT